MSSLDAATYMSENIDVQNICVFRRTCNDLHLPQLDLDMYGSVMMTIIMKLMMTMKVMVMVMVMVMKVLTDEGYGDADADADADAD